MAFEFLRKNSVSIPSSLENKNRNGRKTRDEHRLECQELIDEAAVEAARSLAESIIRKEAGQIIDFGYINEMHQVPANQIISEQKRERMAGEIKKTVLREIRSDRGISEILIAVIERGEKSPKILGRAILEYKKLGEKDSKKLGEIILEELETKK
ncbi:MAG: hypothetical protein WA060_03140 [Minisyncoccia bacterium]